MWQTLVFRTATLFDAASAHRSQTKLCVMFNLSTLEDWRLADIGQQCIYDIWSF